MSLGFHFLHSKMRMITSLPHIKCFAQYPTQGKFWIVGYPALLVPVATLEVLRCSWGGPRTGLDLMVAKQDDLGILRVGALTAT